jgi:hypothetical protein
MRRPVMYLAGLLLATGASLALAGPASAASATGTHCHHDGDDDNTRVVIIHDGDDFPFGGGGYYSNHEGHAYGLINLLSGNGGDGLSL